ncbi:phospholipase, partial [Pseudoduganella sp. RAF53_2]
MKNGWMAAALALTVFAASAPAQAWQQETHRRIVLDAVSYMKNNPGTTNYNKLLAGVTRAGYS